MQGKNERLAVLQEQGIELQIVSPPPPQCYYQSAVEHTVIGSQFVNDGIAEWMGSNPDKILRPRTVPLQDPHQAALELSRCITNLGLKDAMLLTNVDGTEIADDRFRPFWQKAEEPDALIMIHPNGYTEGD